MLASLVTAIATSCAIVTFSSCSSKDCHDEETMQEAAALYQEKRYEDAYRLYKKISMRCPQLAEAHFRLGLIDVIQRNFGQAADHFREVVKRDPGNVTAWRQLAEACSKTRRFKEAAQAFARVYELSHDIQFKEKQGQALLSNGDTDGAKKIFESAVLEDPTNHGSLFYLGNIYRQQGNIDKASRYYEAAIKIKQAMVEAYINLASIRYSQGRYQDAVDLLEKALEEVPLDAPNDPMVRYNLGLSYLKLGNTQKALEHFDKFLALSPEGKNAKEVKEVVQRLRVPHASQAEGM